MGESAPDGLLIAAIRDDLAAAADPKRAPRMQAYMKSAVPCLGVPVPTVRTITRAAARLHPPASVAELGASAAALWRGASHREHRYAATALTGLPMARVAGELLSLHEEMIVTGAWWDHVDEVSHRVGALLLADPDELRPVLLDWSVRPDRWLRRASIIAQLGARGRTDRSAHDGHRRQRGRPRVLHPQGDRLGTARLRPHRTRVGARVRGGAGRPPEPAVAP